MHLDRTAKTRLMAIFIAVVMLASTAGFALIGNTNIAPPPSQGQQLQTNIFYRELTGSELAAILRAGRVVFRYYYPSGCEECKAVSSELEAFARAYTEFLFYQDVTRNESSLEILGIDGRTEVLNISVTQDALLDVLCEKGGLKPKECILREIG